MNTKIEFSVLMSVYYKEKRENLKQCFESIYEKQTLKPNEIILIEDGQLTEELYEEIEIQKIKLKEILRTINRRKFRLRKCLKNRSIKLQI